VTTLLSVFSSKNDTFAEREPFQIPLLFFLLISKQTEAEGPATSQIFHQKSILETLKSH